MNINHEFLLKMTSFNKTSNDWWRGIISFGLAGF